ncbi:MAG: 16S rRNA (cytidine(1402)-2'-O)-methyltransferase [Rickettsiaceae bacterium]|nr:16S rRNA (cytidine(1402)-2'-O)-methyltransferase [Rickettsiaceae bacterium]
MQLKPGLYIISTPIGNLADITLRALEVLGKCDLILCEDTRVTHKLLAKHNISATLKLYHDNIDEHFLDFIEQKILSGKSIGLISDAGTPLISDPGYKLVRKLKQNGVHLDVIPGPCSAIAAITLSGLPTDKFFFHGFLPKTRIAKTNIFEKLKTIEHSLIFYESPSRLLHSLQIALEILGNRQANVSRELTKLFQSSNTDNLSNLIEFYTNTPPKGEIILIISGYLEQIKLDDIESEVRLLLTQNQSVRSTTDNLASKYQGVFNRSEIYKFISNIKKSL